ncbi:transcriptional corepressor SEUSS-like isoform X2 [Canna indica]|uniref:Transcriptional corepressor SEUSS-like isoform X2 n=1 Tax=Canna indica TaxID=4628 RepID=A0AAQ3K5M5_9LILI|nr:transcriptional corepressor SEUSS-like isoform X2 [Canna indica]
MVPSGSSTPIGGAQSVNPSLLRSNSSLLGGSQPGSVPSQPPFSSLVSPRTQFNTNSLLGNISNVSSLNNSFGNGGPVGGLSASSINLQQRGGLGGVVDMVVSSEPNPLLFTSSSGQTQGQQQCFQNPSGNQLGPDQQQSQMDAAQNLQQQFSVPQSQQQQQLRGGLSNMGHMGTVKLEPQMGGPNDQIGPSQQLQNLRSIGAVKMEPQQLQSLRSLGPVKMENNHSDPSSILQQQQQQQHHQQILQLSRQNPQAAAAQMSLLQQQRMLQLQQQQQQQQQIAKALPQQRSQLHQQLLQHNLAVRPPTKPTMYEPGMCARRLTQYMYNQQHRPQDNNIEFWRKFIAEYFAPNAKKRWCVSLYGSSRQTTGVFPQDVWHCEICNHKPGRGFETTVEVLPRLFQIKYASGTLEELLYVDMPREYQNASGQIVLDYAKAIQESVFEQLRVVRDGQLRIVFNPDLKISSWEFCARRHEELIPRRVIIPQVSQLGAVVQRYQAASQNAPSGLSTQDMQSTCNSFVASARHLAKALEVPLVNDLGYTKRYVRCLQISEVVNSMKDLIDYSKENEVGPIDSLMNFPRRTSSGLQQTQPPQQPEQQQSITQNLNHNDHSSAHGTTVQFSAGSNSVVSANNNLNAVSSTSASAATVIGLLQNSMNARQENQMNAVNSPYAGGNAVQIPSASSSNSLPPSQPNPPSPFSSYTPASNNNPAPASHNAAHPSSSNSPASLSTMQQPTSQLHETDPTDSQNSVQQILQELMMSSQLNGVSALGNDVKSINGVTPALNGGNCLVGNGMSNNSALSGTNFAGTGGVGLSTTASGMRQTMTNNAMAMNGRVGMSHLSQDPAAMNHQQQDIGSRLLDRLSSVNSFNNLQFDWKSFQ